MLAEMQTAIMESWSLAAAGGAGGLLLLMALLLWWRQRNWWAPLRVYDREQRALLAFRNRLASGREPSVGRRPGSRRGQPAADDQPPRLRSPG